MKTPLLDVSLDFPTPDSLLSRFRLSQDATSFIREAREIITAILSRKDPRYLLIVGPCSLDDERAALDYAIRLRALKEKVGGSFFIVMRAYFEKSRTSLGWKGLLHDPFLKGPGDIREGLQRSRELLMQLAELKIPLAAEIVTPQIVPYFSDILSWGCIGARSVSSQSHREVASSLAFPCGFKNATDGRISPAVEGVFVAKHPHTYLGINGKGQIQQCISDGNKAAHLVLRGGEGRMNYDSSSLREALSLLKKQGLDATLVVDCSHDNCQKDLSLQKKAFTKVIEEIKQGNRTIAGMMLESYLFAGAQPFTCNPRFGLSLTDPCLGWEETEQLILEASQQTIS